MTRKRRVAVADARFRQAQLRAAEETLRLAADTRRAWINAVSAWETRFLSQPGAGCRRRCFRTRPETWRNRRVHQDRPGARTCLLCRARRPGGGGAPARPDSPRKSSPGSWGFGGRTSIIPSRTRFQPCRKAPRPSARSRREALRNRVDLEIAKLELEALAKSYGLTEATRYVTDLELLDRRGSRARRVGRRRNRRRALRPCLELEFVIPIFDTGKARMRKAELAYMQAANLLAEKAVNIRSEARSAYDAYRSTYDIARHYRNSVVPLRTKIEEEVAPHLQRHDHQHVRASGRHPREDQLDHAFPQRQAQFLAGRSQSRNRHPWRRRQLARRRRSTRPQPKRAAKATEPKETDNAFKTSDCWARAPLLAGAAAWTKTSAMGLPDAAVMESPGHAAADLPDERARLPAGRHAQRLDAAASHEQRREGVPSCRRAGRAGVGARHDRLSVGLQRPVARSDDRGGRRRPGPHLRHQQAAGAHDHPLARHDPAERHGWRDRPYPAGHPARQDLRLRVRSREERHLHVPPARRRNGPDGHGHDGLLRHPSRRTRNSCASTAISCSC